MTILVYHKREESKKEKARWLKRKEGKEQYVQRRGNTTKGGLRRGKLFGVVERRNVFS